MVANENGRSMVEMLGVIAIIGVISIAGLQGYTAAMKRLRANELLNEASKLATLAAMQIAAGRNPSDEPDSNFVPEFDNSAFKIGRNNKTNKFDIQISDIPQDVCEQMQEMVENSIMQMNGECDGTSPITLTFNDDLSKISDNVDGGSSGADNEKEEEIPEEPVVNESCTSPTATNNPGDITSEQTADGPCRCPENKPQWDDTKLECVVAETKGTCTTYNTNECGSGYYCRFRDARGPNNLPPAGGDSGHPVTYMGDQVQGTCTKITGEKQIKGHYYYTGETLDYFSAYSWCLGKGSTGLITLNTLNAIGNYPANTVVPGFTDPNHGIYEGFCSDTVCLDAFAYWTAEVGYGPIGHPVEDYTLSSYPEYDYIDDTGIGIKLAVYNIIYTLCE